MTASSTLGRQYNGSLEKEMKILMLYDEIVNLTILTNINNTLKQNLNK